MHGVLIIDDDRELCALMKACVLRDGFHVLTASSGAEGLRLLAEQPCALVVLDIMLPDMDGFHVLERLREASNVPVLMLTAKSGEEDKVYALTLGADDYLTKPFSMNELRARVRSLIRRYTALGAQGRQEEAPLELRGMVIDRANRTVTRDGIPVELTGREFDLLLFLAANRGRVLTRKQIYAQVWAEDYAMDDGNMMSFISKLRRKIEPDPEHPFYIQTVRGVGYRFNRDAQKEG